MVIEIILKREVIGLSGNGVTYEKIASVSNQKNQPGL